MNIIFLLSFFVGLTLTTKNVIAHSNINVNANDKPDTRERVKNRIRESIKSEIRAKKRAKQRSKKRAKNNSGGKINSDTYTGFSDYRDQAMCKAYLKGKRWAYHLPKSDFNFAQRCPGWFKRRIPIGSLHCNRAAKVVYVTNHGDGLGCGISGRTVIKKQTSDWQKKEIHLTTVWSPGKKRNRRPRCKYWGPIRGGGSVEARYGEWKVFVNGKYLATYILSSNSKGNNRDMTRVQTCRIKKSPK